MTTFEMTKLLAVNAEASANRKGLLAFVDLPQDQKAELVPVLVKLMKHSSTPDDLRQLAAKRIASVWGATPTVTHEQAIELRQWLPDLGGALPIELVQLNQELVGHASACAICNPR